MFELHIYSFQKFYLKERIMFLCMEESNFLEVLYLYKLFLSSYFLR